MINSQQISYEKDNLWTFKSNGTYKADEGATKCDVDDDQVITGN